MLLCLTLVSVRRSAVSTVEIFRSLISNHAEVDVDKAVSVGLLSDGPASAAAGDVSGMEGTEHEEEDVAPAGYYDEAAPRPTKSSASMSITGKSAEVPEDSARASARDILLSLPGINVHNFRDVMNSVTNVAELSAMKEEQLLPLIGPINAKKLYSFFTQNP